MKRTQTGQAMVEYVVVLALGVFVLLGPGTDVIRYTLRAIKDNFEGYSYAMSLSEWPEFEIAHLGPIATPSNGWRPNTEAPGMERVGSVGSLPARATEPTADPGDWFFFLYRLWLEDNAVPDERVDELAGPGIDDVLNDMQDFIEGQIPVFDEFPEGLPPSVGDLVQGFLPF